LRQVLAGFLLLCTMLLPVQAAPSPDDCDAEDVATVLRPATTASPPAARAIWLNESLLRWPGVAASGRFRLHHSADGTTVAESGMRVTGAEGALELEAFAGSVPSGVEAGFRHVADGVTLRTTADAAALRTLHQQQLLLVQEGPDGHVIRATLLQSAAALDQLFPAAEQARLGATIARGRTTFALWAPTARNVALCIYESGSGSAQSLEPMQRDDVTGVWSAALDRNLSGRYYTYLVDVHVDGVGVVRNRVTDPYAVSLTADSRRAYVAELSSPRLKPAGWDSTASPRRVQAQTDAVIYELHVRDFSIGDRTVRPGFRGKYLAFTQDDTDGMRHLRALASAGVTDVHLLPVFDFGSVPEQGCVTPSPAGPPAGESQQVASRPPRAVSTPRPSIA